jgi:hypothetical protein
MKQIRHIVDGVNLDASHYAVLGKDKAIAKMKKDKVPVPEGKEATAWYGEAFDKISEAHDNAQKEEDPNKKLKTVTSEMQEAQGAEEEDLDVNSQ